MNVGLMSMFAVAAVLTIAGCGHQTQGRFSLPPDGPTGDRSILAGEWEYADGGVALLRLDAQGNGTYAYKDGRFETQQFDGTTWVGKWYQKENDREGGFLVQLSPDSAEGEGRWWYDRIGPKPTPAEKGGTFHLSRKTSITSLRDTPPPP